MHDSRETKMKHAFVVGYPITHSRSPMIHGYWLKQHGISGGYEKLAVEPVDFAGFLSKLLRSDSGYQGGNVTIPHKESAYQLADYPDALAEELGAANTLWLENGALHATNTDGYGFIANLDQQQPGWDNTDCAVVLGAGGASRAIIQAIRNRGIAKIHVVNRTKEKAQDLATRFGPSVEGHGFDALNDVLQGAGLLINTTSLGMSKASNADSEAFPTIAWEKLAADAVVTDIVYVPLETELLRRAREAGFATVDGLGMLLHQAVPGFEKWFGVRPEVTDELRQLIIVDLEAS
ncbi:shikimate dehydrogenase [Rhizobium oryziradicis]|uniref:Shikimate dehydrogenase (NADP(+)) n=1 Tax=Rhizobium oryziradicis TaxID=1867956 RepID=A0A1Q8ZLJ9_9HYPH|nr:shikimate dehydrogenase [Rhizobium oryziradicis]OLP42613.1 shikimate dehydrogenase [Rhizobium oryziradicis]